MSGIFDNICTAVHTIMPCRIFGRGEAAEATTYATWILPPLASLYLELFGCAFTLIYDEELKDGLHGSHSRSSCLHRAGKGVWTCPSHSGGLEDSHDNLLEMWASKCSLTWADQSTSVAASAVPKLNTLNKDSLQRGPIYSSNTYISLSFRSGLELSGACQHSQEYQE